jgi:hypothetical protein
VTVAPCDVRGRPLGPAAEAVGSFVAPADRARALAALRHRYGLRFQVGLVTSRLWQRLTRPGTERHELLRISPA